MKKLFLLAGLVVTCAFISCNALSDQVLISNRIQSLETAINEGGTTGYKDYCACFASTDNFQNGVYTLALYESAYPQGQTSWSFGDITVSGSVATCTSSTTVGLLSASYNNEFDMVKIGSDWFIQIWKENGVVIFQSKQPSAQQ